MSKVAQVADRPVRPGPRGPGLVYAALGVTLLVLLATVALTTRQPPPPSIAEFAPQAVEQIKDAPTEQSSDFGSGQGGTRLDAAPTPEPAAGPAGIRRPQLDVPRIRRCVGNPPRQIEDPQSPPCVPYWEGDNGGNTWRGVTRDEIRVMIPTPQNKVAFFERLKTFFNRRFEFYGRKLTFVYGANENSAGSPQSANQKAEAEYAFSKDIFISSWYRGQQGFYYHEDLARRGVLNITYGIYDSAWHRNRRPYLWSYLADSDSMLADLGEWACARLAHRPAAHAGDPALQTRDRVFGVILQDAYDEQKTSVAPIVTQLRRCDARTAEPLVNPVRTGTSESQQATGLDPASANSAILKMREQDVTSIFCLCQPYAAGAIMKAASNQAYLPEWLISSYGALDLNGVITAVSAGPPEQMAHAFGLTFQPRQLRPTDEPYWWALKEVDPSFVTEADSVNLAIYVSFYRPLLMLAAAIQMAGPRLTPETLERGLQRARFPNPDHPNMPGKVGLNGGRYTMTLDAAEYWWSNSDPSPYTPSSGGTICYAAGGRRYTSGSWPRDPDPFFQGPCDSGA